MLSPSSEKLIADYNGEIPRSREELEKLPGVGRKTANVVLNIAFGEETIAVDTPSLPPLKTAPSSAGKTPLEVELGLQKVIPKNSCSTPTIG